MKTTNKGEAIRRANRFLTELTNPQLMAAVVAPSASLVDPIRGASITEVIEAFLEASRLSVKASSVKCYERTLSEFEAFCATQDIFKFEQLNARLYEAFMRHLALTKRPSTVSNQCNYLGIWAKWACTKRDYAEKSPFRNCAPPKVSSISRFCPSLKQLKSILNHAPAKRCHDRPHSRMYRASCR